METTLLAHELGHAFGLRHTFHNTNCIAGPAFFPETPVATAHTCNRGVPCSSGNPPVLSDVNCFDCANLCECNGDGICDTNVDPGPQLCPTGEEGEPCIINIGGTDYEYYPDYFNVMSYYTLEFRTRFSFLQKAEMLTCLEESYSYLIDTDVPNNCETIDKVDYLVAPGGSLMYFQQDGSNNEPTLQPMGNIQIKRKNTDVEFQECSGSTNETGNYDNCSWVSEYLVDQNIRISIEQDQFQAATGVSTFDIIRLQRHILNLDLITDPYALIAGDVNNSESVTTLDIILMRKVILGLIQDFPEAPAWRFLPRYALDNKFNFESDFYENPFTAEWTLADESIKKYKGTDNSYLGPLDLNLLNEDVVEESTWSFIGIKTGDINFSTNLDLNGISEPSSDDDIYKSNLSSVSNNEELVLRFLLVGDQSLPHPRPKVWGYQFEVQFNPQKLELLGVFPVLDGVHPIEEEAYCLDINTCTVRTLWYTNGNDAWEIPSMFQTQNLFAIKLKAKSSIAYGELGNYVQLNTSNYKNQFFDEDLNLLDVNLDYGQVDPVQFKLQNIYPNPTQTNVNFDFVIEQGDSPIKITITDGNGQQVTTTRYYAFFGPTTIGMNVGNLSNGLLTANIKIGNAQPFNKLLTKVN